MQDTEPVLDTKSETCLGKPCGDLPYVVQQGTGLGEVTFSMVHPEIRVAL